MPSSDPEIVRIARRVKWWEPAEETLSDRDDFLCRVMNFGTWDDIVYVDQKYGENAFRRALSRCRAGVMEAALGAAKALYPQFNPAVSLKALAYFDDLPKLPAEIRRSLTKAVAAVRQIPEVPKQSQSLVPG